MGDSSKCHPSSQGCCSTAASRLSGPRAVLSEPVRGRSVLRKGPLPALPFLGLSQASGPKAGFLFRALAAHTAPQRAKKGEGTKKRDLFSCFLDCGNPVSWFLWPERQTYFSCQHHQPAWLSKGDPVLQTLSHSPTIQEEEGTSPHPLQPAFSWSSG